MPPSRARRATGWSASTSTRALTAFNSRHVGGFQKTTAGRVQTPTLAILVEREEKIRAFKPRTYWEVFGDFGVAAGAYRGRWFDETFKKAREEDARAERIWDAPGPRRSRQNARAKPGTVDGGKKAADPDPAAALRSDDAPARGEFPLRPSRRTTLQIAQALYERHKVLTYPRTDSRYLPEDYLGTARNVMGGFDRSLACPPRRQGARERLGPPEQAHFQQREGLRSLCHRPDRRRAEGAR